MHQQDDEKSEDEPKSTATPFPPMHGGNDTSLTWAQEDSDASLRMEGEWKVSFTPHEVGTIVINLTTRLRTEKRWPATFRIENWGQIADNKDVDKVVIDLPGTRNYAPYIGSRPLLDYPGKVTVHRTLDGTSLLTVSATSNHQWAAIERWWELLLKELTSNGNTIADSNEPDEREPLTPQHQYNKIIDEARERARQNGLTPEEPPITGDIAIPEWFLAYWLPLGKSQSAYAERISARARTVQRLWEDYREAHGIPTIPEIKKLRDNNTGES